MRETLRPDPIYRPLYYVHVYADKPGLRGILTNIHGHGLSPHRRMPQVADTQSSRVQKRRRAVWDARGGAPQGRDSRRRALRVPEGFQRICECPFKALRRRFSGPVLS